MKFSYFLILTMSLFTLAACEQKHTDPAEVMANKIDDALDRRPNEKILDAIEDIGDSVNNAIERFQEELEEIANEIEQQNQD